MYLNACCIKKIIFIFFFTIFIFFFTKFKFFFFIFFIFIFFFFIFFIFIFFFFSFIFFFLFFIFIFILRNIIKLEDVEEVLLAVMEVQNIVTLIILQLEALNLQEAETTLGGGMNAVLSVTNRTVDHIQGIVWVEAVVAGSTSVEVAVTQLPEVEDPAL